ncbi:14913_t:CDS:2 [Racocetra fulgida]|uniref:14913_t:CDS:1 n=1 Tax=Racocetra fulgida TaxID=60492 RepID=A0A9N9F241_9GLOM|nr:14913_t:CDS:2 [Racocetra fulgida]
MIFGQYPYNDTNLRNSTLYSTIVKDIELENIEDFELESIKSPKLEKGIEGPELNSIEDPKLKALKVALSTD